MEVIVDNVGVVERQVQEGESGDAADGVQPVPRPVPQLAPKVLYRMQRERREAK